MNTENINWGHNMITNSFGELSILLAMIVCVWVIGGSPLESHAADEASHREERTITAASKRWKKMFGQVDFADEMLFERMAYLHPQPEASFRSFTDEVLSDAVQINHSEWMKRFFKGPLLEVFAAAKPCGYYLNGGSYEPSLLLYEGTVNGGSVSIQENFNVVLITFTPEGFSASEGIEGEAVNRLLSDCLNSENANSGDTTWYPDLTGHLREGVVFSNNRGAQIQRITDWRRDIVGFVSERGISLLLFKVQPEVPRARVGLAYDFNWLNKGLLEKDGKTLVDQRFNLDGQTYKRKNHKQVRSAKRLDESKDQAINDK